MKHLFFLLFISTIGYSQELEDILKTKQFVLEANKISDDEGKLDASSKRLCFILIDSSKIVVQWIAGCDNNGLGGITMHGIINSYSFSKSNINKEIQHILNLDCEMDEGRVKSEIIIEMHNKSHADAVLKNSSASIFIPKEMTFLGKIVPLQTSKVMVGSF